MEIQLAIAIHDLDVMQLERVLKELRMKNKEAFDDLKEIVEDL